MALKKPSRPSSDNRSSTCHSPRCSGGIDDRQDHDSTLTPQGRFADPGGLCRLGLTGRKIIVDTYGGRGRHGGGAFSGKDPTKVDRSATYASRWAAKHVVAAGLSTEYEIQLTYAIGVADPVSIRVDTFGTGKLADETIAELVDAQFSFKPGHIIRDLGLAAPIYGVTAAGGHFGRRPSGQTFPWEKLNPGVINAFKAAPLRVIQSLREAMNASTL